MDLLSTAVDSIAVLLHEARSELHELLLLWEAPTELLALANETEALRGLLVIVQLDFRRDTDPDLRRSRTEAHTLESSRDCCVGITTECGPPFKIQ